MARRPPRFLAISDGRQSPGAPFRDWVRRLSASGVDALQVREKAATDRDRYELALEARAAAAGALTLLVNGRADIAIAAGLDGVHLPAAGLPLELLRELLGSDALIGLSTHHLEEVERAAAEGADYVTFGPVYATPSKAADGPPVGLAGLARAAAAGLPVIALGGITMERAGECFAAGAHGIAAIRMFARPEALTGLEQLARRFRA